MATKAIPRGDPDRDRRCYAAFIKGGESLLTIALREGYTSDTAVAGAARRHATRMGLPVPGPYQRTFNRKMSAECLADAAAIKAKYGHVPMAERQRWGATWEVSPKSFDYALRPMRRLLAEPVGRDIRMSGPALPKHRRCCGRLGKADAACPQCGSRLAP